MVRRGELQRADRDRPRPPRLRVGRLALPRDRGDGRRLGRDRRLAAAQRARQHRRRRDVGVDPPRRRGRDRPLDPRRHGVRRRRHRARGGEARAGAHDRPRDGRHPPRRRRLRPRRSRSRAERGVRIPMPRLDEPSCRSPPSGDPVLRERADELSPDELATPEIQRLIDDLIETKRAAGGAGLAATQVSVAERIAVVEVDEHTPLPVQAARPADRDRQPGDRVRSPTSGCSINEGCLSVPGLRGDVERAVDVRVHYLDRDGDASRARSTARPDRRHLPARGRPPRRRPVPRPRHRPADLHHLGAVRAPPRDGVRRAGSRVVAGAWISVSRFWCEQAWLGGVTCTAGVLIEVDRRADRRPCRRASTEAPDGAQVLAGLDAPRPRQRPLPRLPARPARAHSEGRARLVLDLARADVRARRRARSRLDARARPCDVRRDGARRDHASSASSTTSTTRRRKAVR